MISWIHQQYNKSNNKTNNIRTENKRHMPHTNSFIKITIIKNWKKVNKRKKQAKLTTTTATILTVNQYGKK